MVEAIAQGYPQQEIQDAAYRAQRALETRESLVVGLNEFREEDPPPEGLLRVNETVERTQAARLAALRKERDGASVQRRLDALRAAAKDERQNLVPLIFDAVKSLATLGEILWIEGPPPRLVAPAGDADANLTGSTHAPILGRSV